MKGERSVVVQVQGRRRERGGRSEGGLQQPRGWLMMVVEDIRREEQSREPPEGGERRGPGSLDHFLYSRMCVLVNHDGAFLRCSLITDVGRGLKRSVPSEESSSSSSSHPQSCFHLPHFGRQWTHHTSLGLTCTSSPSRPPSPVLSLGCPSSRRAQL